MLSDSLSSQMPQEAPVATSPLRRRASIGLPKSGSGCDKCFPLTPEAAGVLVRMGFDVLVEGGAATHIHYADADYVQVGAKITGRDETLKAEIVIHLAPLAVADIRKLRRGALLLGLSNFNRQNVAEVVHELLGRRVINIAVDLVRDTHGNKPFGDILLEIAGRSAITVATAMLADSAAGKGILLGGIAGVVPCEVTIIGSCLAACAAARSALGLGAVVRMFDHDVYRLRVALRMAGNGVIGSSLHSNVLENALRTADVIVVTDCRKPLPTDVDTVKLLKREALIFDISPNPGTAFPKTLITDLGGAHAVAGDTAVHKCFTNPGSTVPRTTAMALSDTFVTMLGRIAGCEDAGAMLPLTPGLQEATLTFMGKVVNERVAQLAGVRCTDLRLLLSLC